MALPTVSFDSSADISFTNTFGSQSDQAASQANNNLTRTNEDSSRRAVIDKVINIYLRHNTTLICLEDVMDLYNEDREDCVKLPDKKKSILKLFYENRDLIRVVYMVKCDKCEKTTRIDSESTETVKCCETILKKTETNFFVYLPVEDQISRSVKNNWSHIKNFDSNSSNGDSYSDAHDGEVLKKIASQYKESHVNILSLCLNIDGANKYKSNTMSLWPIQLSQNYLPPEIRFQTDNIIVAGLYYGKVKMNCRNVMLPLVEELNQLNKHPIKLNIEENEYEFKPIITHCAVDLPAKSMVQEIKQFGGYFSCTFCKIRGEQVLIKKKPTKKNKSKNNQAIIDDDEIQANKFVRYVEGSETHELRDQAETLKQMLFASNSNKDLDGVKDVSCLVAFEHFDIIKSIGVEYMHCVLLGVTKQILSFFLNSKYSGKDFYITPKTRQLLNKRILALKPPAYVVRKPRSLEEKANFKASEYRFFLLYYLPVCLAGLVPNKYLQHVRRLSAAVYILLQTTIPKDEVDDAEKMLHKFVKDHQDYFEKQSMVMNVHLVKHLAESVRQLGPLWCHSAFPFERNNGVLLKMANGTTDVLLQVSSKYTLSKSLPKKIKKSSEKVLLGKSVQINEHSLQVLNIKTHQKLDWSNVVLSVHKRIQLGRITYTSLMYTRPKRSIDYFIRLKNDDFGMAKFYIEHNDQIYVIMEKFEAVDYLDHITKVRSTKQNIMALIADIDLKCVYMKVGLNQYVCSAPNPYEIE